MLHQRITFKGDPYLLIGETEGAIATEEQYRTGECSFAHLFPNGEVKRFGEVIGSREDIVFLGEAHIDWQEGELEDAFLNAAKGWKKPKKKE